MIKPLFQLVLQVLKDPGNRNVSPQVQFVKYAMVGAVATAVHFGLQMVFGLWLFPAMSDADPLVQLGWVDAASIDELLRARHARWNTWLAFFVSNTICYIMNIKWVFTPGRHHPVIECILFFLVSGLAIFLGAELQVYLIKQFGLAYTYSSVAQIAVSVMINYVLRKFAVFKN
jgi:putative flippase GtrA